MRTRPSTFKLKRATGVFSYTNGSGRVDLGMLSRVRMVQITDVESRPSRGEGADCHGVRVGL